MLHKNSVVGDNHYIQQWSVVDTTARDALSVVPADVGKVCQVTGTSLYYILTDDSPMTWQVIAGGSGSGDVVGPASATDNAVVRFDGTTGKLIQNSAVTIADTSGDITGGKYNTVAISGASSPTLAVTGTTTVSGANTGDQNLFSTIAVSGQSNVVADTTSDTLTLAAGSNITITTNATTDTITIASSGGGGGYTLLTPVTLTTQTSVDFTIPSGAKQVNMLFNGISGNGSSNIEVRLGDGGGIETTGYSGTVSFYSDASQSSDALAGSGFTVQLPAAGNTASGILSLHLMDSSNNTWAANGGVGVSNGVFNISTSGVKSLSAELTTVRLTTVNGTDQLDAGIVNCNYI